LVKVLAGMYQEGIIHAEHAIPFHLRPR
jgi:hypothetical protein